MSKLIAGPFTGSFVHLSAPHAVNAGDEEKYSIMIVLPKDDPFWAKAEKIAKQTAAERWGKVPAKLQLTINDGDLTDDQNRAGCNYMTVSSKADRRPEVVDRDRNPILDPSEIYSGASYYASLRPYAWTYGGKQGVSFGLNHVMKVADGDRLDNRGSAAKDFGDLEFKDFADDFDDSTAPLSAKASAANLL